MGQGQKLRRTGRGFSLCGGRGEDMDEKRFEAAKNKIIGKTREKTSIGTFREKTVHAVLKHYYSPDENTHEVAVGNYVADIFDGNPSGKFKTVIFIRSVPSWTLFLHNTRLRSFSRFPITNG